MTGRKLDPKQFGMNDLHDLFISLSDVLRIEYREKSKCLAFLLCTLPVQWCRKMLSFGGKAANAMLTVNSVHIPAPLVS